MTPYGLALLGTLLLGSLPWSYAFEAFGNLGQAAKHPLGLALGFLFLSTGVYTLMLSQFAPDGRGWLMIAFLTLTLHALSIAVAGLCWSIFGQGAARRFLTQPTPFLYAALACALLSLGLGLTFTPST